MSARRPSARSACRRWLLSWAASMGCHLVAVTLLAGRLPAGRSLAAPLDGVFALDNATTFNHPPNDRPPPPAVRPARRDRSAIHHQQDLAARVRPSLASATSPAPRAPRTEPESAAPEPPQPGDGRPSGGATPEAPTPARAPPVVSGVVARALRVYDTFPRMPEILRMGAHAEITEAEICVSEQGSVHSVRLRGASAPLEHALRAAILTWRYRPYVMNGQTVPFCHVSRFVYGAPTPRDP